MGQHDDRVDAPLRDLLGVVTISSVFGAPFLTLMPVVAREKDGRHSATADLAMMLILMAVGVLAVRVSSKPSSIALVSSASGRSPFVTRRSSPSTSPDATTPWRRSAIEIDRHVRGMQPWPGAWTTLDDRRIHVRRAQAVTGDDAMRATGLHVVNVSFAFSGTVSLSYLPSGVGSGVAETEEFDLPALSLDLTPSSTAAIVPGSLMLTYGGRTYIDRNGTLYYGISATTGAGTAGGTIDYTTGVATITAHAIPSSHGSGPFRTTFRGGSALCGVDRRVFIVGPLRVRRDGAEGAESPGARRAAVGVRV